MTYVFLATIIGAWTVLYLLFYGLGVLVAAMAGIRHDRFQFAHFWIGWGAVIAILQVVQLFKPVDSMDQIASAALGILGLAISRRSFPLRLKSLVSLRAAVATISVALLCYFVARHSLVPPRAYDTGTYHLPYVLWLNSYPIIPGLGNLHIRLAFNSSAFLYDALMNVGPLSGLTLNISLGLLVSAVSLELIWMATALLAKAKWSPLCGACLIAIPFLLFQTFGIPIEGLSTDIVVFCCGVEMAILLLRLSSSSKVEGEHDLFRFALVFLAAVSCSVKLSFVGLGITAMLWVWFSGGPALWNGRSRRSQMMALGLSALVVAGWTIRNAVLSGYPFFPLPAFGMPVAWRIPLETVRQNLGWTRAWARLVEDDSMRVPFSEILSSSRWVGPYIRHAATDYWNVVLPVGIFLAAISMVIMFPALRKGVSLRGLTLFLPPVAGILYWWFSAPDIRFAAAMFVMLAMMGVELVLQTTSADARWRRGTLVLLCSLSLILCAKQVNSMCYWWRTWPAAYSFRNPPNPLTTSFQTSSGLALQVPVRLETCWAAPLPCTPYPSSFLRLRRNDDLSSGFQVAPFRDDLIVGWWTESHPWWEMKPPR